MDNIIYQQYSQVNLEIKKLTEVKKELSEKIVTDLQKRNELNERTEYGYFFLKSSPVYEFTDEVKQKELELKELKKKEIETGKAIVAKNSTSLSMR